MKAVILAGGAGTRMRPLTYVVPKCLLPVGGKPLLDRTIQYLRGYGFREFVVCVAYLKKQIIDAYGDGSELGVKIDYAEADLPLGTGGQLKTAEPFIDGRFLAMNGDIITNLNIQKMLASHEVNGSIGTIALKKFEVKIPYGYITTSADSSIAAFREKPTLKFNANAGIYALEPKVLDYAPPRGIRCSLETDVFPQIISCGEKLNSYFEDAYWADVGSMTDFERVNDEILPTPYADIQREM